MLLYTVASLAKENDEITLILLYKTNIVKHTFQLRLRLCCCNFKLLNFCKQFFFKCFFFIVLTFQVQ